jgi:hypothetical protein
MNNPTGAPLNLLLKCNQPCSRDIINPPKGVWSTPFQRHNQSSYRGTINPPFRKTTNPPTGAQSTLLLFLLWGTINPPTVAELTSTGAQSILKHGHNHQPSCRITMNNPTGALSTLLSERNQPCSKDAINHPKGCIMNPSPEALSTPFYKSMHNQPFCRNLISLFPGSP